MKARGATGFYIFIAALLLGMLLVTGRYFNGSKYATVGVTYAKEYVIKCEKSALVKSVSVVPGQQVKPGDILVELTSRQLNMDIDKLQNQIVALKTEQQEKSKLVNSEISYLKAEYGISVESIDASMIELKSELALNQKLADQFIAKSTEKDASQDPHQLRLSSLNQQKVMREKAMDIKVQELVQKNTTEQTLFNNQITLLSRELVLLLEEQKKLNRYATFSGVVENVYVKNGEEVNAFTSMLSINPAHPTTVIAYITGRKDKVIPMASLVNVRSYDRLKNESAGTVIGFGSVVELPVILQKSTAVKAFGRQVFIEIAPDNEFATGEKVLIK
jgi:multidrug resistance efflux pump